MSKEKFNYKQVNILKNMGFKQVADEDVYYYESNEYNIVISLLESMTQTYSVSKSYELEIELYYSKLTNDKRDFYYYVDRYTRENITTINEAFSYLMEFLDDNNNTISPEWKHVTRKINKYNYWVGNLVDYNWDSYLSHLSEILYNQKYGKKN